VLVRRIHRVYHERWQVMSRALGEHFSGWSHSPGFGGSSYWLTGPDSLDAEELAQRALAEGVLIEAGTPFYIDPEEGRHRFRLGFSSIPAERIGEGVRRLRAVTDAMG
jgi:GntR family transcriptional regulator/MocR family aminotransferase